MNLNSITPARTPDLSLNVRSKVDSYTRFLIFIKERFPVSLTHLEAWRQRSALQTYMCVRHDVDHNLETAAVMAKVEEKCGVRASYYVLPPGAYDADENYYGKISGWKIERNPRLTSLCKLIHDYGHEIGLHNDFLQLASKLNRPVSRLIEEEINFFASIGIEIKGTASHGSQFARDRQFVNYDIFSDRGRAPAAEKAVMLPNEAVLRLPCCSMAQLGLEYEAYDLPRDFRVSDVGGKIQVSVEKKTVTTDFVNGKFSELENIEGTRCIALVHPEHWSEHDGFQTGRNMLSPAIRMENTAEINKTGTATAATMKEASATTEESFPDLLFARPDGKPFRIGIRGDCVCRRAVQLNQDLFPKGVVTIINEKAPNRVFADTLAGRMADWGVAQRLTNVAEMSRSLSAYFQYQFERSILDAKDLDLVIMDTYSDMNFQLWRHKSQDWRMWIHPRFTDMVGLAAEFEKENPIPFEDAVEDVCLVIDAIRANNPNVPILYLYQPVEYYNKLDLRKNFYKMGEVISGLRPYVYFADVLSTDELGPADVGSCGPGQTLHFDGTTYRKMISYAWKKGLCLHFSRQHANDPIAILAAAPEQIATSTNHSALHAAAFESDAPPELADVDPTNLPTVAVSYGHRRPLCTEACGKAVDAAYKTFSQYFTHPELGEAPAPKRFNPMVIPFSDRFDFAAWEQRIGKFGKGARLRQKRKAEKLGFVCKPFAWRLHIPDVHEINHSKDERSGGPMRGGYLRSIEEMGGAPTQKFEVALPRCNNHWNLMFGAFKQIDGYMQGEVVTNEKLIAYISLRRTGDVVLYSQILGHGNYLNEGALILLHHEVIRWLSENTAEASIGLRYVIYGGAQNGGQSLYRWKRQAGFKPCLITAYRSDRLLEEASLVDPNNMQITS